MEREEHEMSELERLRFMVDCYERLTKYLRGQVDAYKQLLSPPVEEESEAK